MFVDDSHNTSKSVIKWVYSRNLEGKQQETISIVYGLRGRCISLKSICSLTSYFFKGNKILYCDIMQDCYVGY